MAGLVMDCPNPSVCEWLLVLYSKALLYLTLLGGSSTHSLIRSFTYTSTHIDIQHISPDLPVGCKGPILPKHVTGFDGGQLPSGTEISSDHLDPVDIHSTRAIA